MTIKNLIKKNLFFKVDFNSKYSKKKGEKIKQVIKFFFIGVLPIAIEYNNGKFERSILQTAIEVKQDKYLRLLHGVRYNKIKQAQEGIFKKFKVRVNYSKEADIIVNRTAKAIEKIMNDKKFMNIKIEEVRIININSL